MYVNAISHLNLCFLGARIVQSGTCAIPMLAKVCSSALFTCKWKVKRDNASANQMYRAVLENEFKCPYAALLVARKFLTVGYKLRAWCWAHYLKQSWYWLISHGLAHVITSKHGGAFKTFCFNRSICKAMHVGQHMHRKFTVHERLGININRDR
jgi:hypothetical protein